MRCSCGSTDVDYDSNGVNVVCVNCGLVLSENSIVSEVNFTESSSGVSSVVGQFVSSSSSRGLSSTAKKPNSAGYGRDSREQTLNAGRKACQQLSDLLRLKPHHVEAATRYFALAVQHNFIQGRRTSNVVAACLYIVCRREKTSHLLIDFADVLQTNLYVLGSTLLKFIRVLHISLPIIDPSLYIHRFAAQLELQPLPQSTSSSPSSGGASSSSVNPIIDSEASAVHIVAMTALRLVARMKRDWLQVGRRPSGICGACLLIACRMHGYRRTQREILDVVKICDATLRRRMLEFVNSSGSEMTFQEFEQKTEQQHQHARDRHSNKRQKTERDDATVNTSMNSIEEEEADEDYDDDDTTITVAAMSTSDSIGHDPPAFIRAQETDATTQRLQARASEVEAELRNRGLLPNDTTLKGEWERELNELLQTEEFQQQRESVTLNQDVSLRKLIQEHFRAVSQGYSEQNINNNDDLIQVKKQEPQDEEETKQFTEEKKMEPHTSTRQGRAAGTGANAYVGLTAAEAAALADGEYLLANLAKTGTGQAEASSSIARDVDIKPDAAAAPVALDLSDVSDAEMSEYLLDENEVAFKTRMWDHIHSAYLQQQAEKKAVKAEAEAAAAQTQQTSITPKKPIIRKKDRLTASEAFINATSITNNNTSITATNTTATSATSRAQQTHNMTNVVQPTPASTTSTATAAAMATLPYQTSSSSTHRQPKRVSEKINYTLLQGLLRNKKDDDSKEAESQQQYWANHSTGIHLDHTLQPWTDDHPNPTRNGAAAADDRAYEVVED